MFIHRNVKLLQTFVFISFSCTPHWSASTVPGMCYNWLLIAKGFFVPTLVIIFSNVLVTKKLRVVRNAKKPQVNVRHCKILDKDWSMI